MRTVSLEEVQAQLFQLIEKAAKDEPFVITKAGKPIVKVIPIDEVRQIRRRVGFMAGQFSVPDDFDQLGSTQIERLFDNDG